MKTYNFSLAAKNPTGIALAKSTMSLCYLMEGKVNPAYELAKESLTLVKETGDDWIKGIAYAVCGMSCYHKGFFEEAKVHFLEYVSSYEKSSPIPWTAWDYEYLGYVYIDLREYDDAVNCYKKIIPFWENYSLMPSISKHFQSCLMRAKVLRHDQDIELSELYACYENYKITWCKGWTASNIGDALLNMDNDHLSDAEVWFQKAIEEDTKNGFRWVLAQDHASYANCFKKKDDRTGVKEQLTKAIDIFRECSADGWVEKYEKELALL